MGARVCGVSTEGGNYFQLLGDGDKRTGTLKA